MVKSWPVKVPVARTRVIKFGRLPASNGKIEKRNFSVSTIAASIFLEIPRKPRGSGRFAFNKHFLRPGIRRRTSDRWRVHNGKQRAFAYPCRVLFFSPAFPTFERFELKSRGFEIADLRWVNGYGKHRWPLRRGTTNEDSILKLYKSHSAQHRGGILYGGTRVRKLRRNFHSALATRWYGPLPVQRVRSLPQDERNESTLGEAATAIGKEEIEEIRRPAKRSRER